MEQAASGRFGYAVAPQDTIAQSKDLASQQEKDIDGEGQEAVNLRHERLLPIGWCGIRFVPNTRRSRTRCREKLLIGMP